MPSDTKKSRDVAFILNAESIAKLRFNTETLEATALDEGENEISVDFSKSISYCRESGKPKFIEKGQGQSSRLPMHIYDIAKQFDCVVIVDTNKRHIGVSEVAACCFYILIVNEDEDNYLLHGDASVCYYQICGEFGNPELVAIYLILEVFFKNEGINCPSDSILIITDTEMSRHSDINSRNLPLIGQYYLPSPNHIYYSGSDALGGTFNDALRFCDKAASNLLDKISSGDLEKGEWKPLPINAKVFYKFYHRSGVSIENSKIPKKSLKFKANQLILAGVRVKPAES